MSKLNRWLKAMYTALRYSWERFPEALIAAYLFGFLSIFNHHYNATLDAMSTLFIDRMMIVLVSAVPLFLLTATLHERMGFKYLKRIFIDMGCILALIGLYFTIPETFSAIFGFRIFVLNISLYLAFTLVPFWLNKSGYSLYILQLFSRVSMTILYSLVLFIGTSAIFFSIDQLLGIHVDGKVYFDSFILIATLFAPTFFLGDILYVHEEVESIELTRLFKVLFIHIIMTLLLIYTTILYAYFGKIVIARHLPQNMIVHLVLWYSFIIILTTFFTETFKGEFGLSRWFHKWMPYLILLPLAMLLFSLSLRIFYYGYTVQRYFVLALSIWVVGTTIYFIVRKVRIYQVTVLFAIVLMFISMYGPLNAFNISKMSQLNRFNTLLTETGLLQDGKIVPNPDLPLKQQREVINLLEYFKKEQRLSDLPFIESDTFDLYQDDLKHLFGFSYGFVSREEQVERYFRKDDHVALNKIDIKKYTQLEGVQYASYDNKMTGIEIVNQTDLKILTPQDGKDAYVQIPMEATLALILENDTLTSEESLIYFKNGDQDCLFIVRELSGSYNYESNQYNISIIKGYLLK